MTPEQRSAWRALVLMVHLVDAELERQTQQDAGIPHSHFKILALLDAAPDRTMGLSALSQALRFHKSRLSHALGKLEAAGLLRREDTPERGRAYQAVLTSQGVALVRRTIPLQEAYVRDSVLAGLNDVQLAQLRAIAETITGNLDQDSL